MLKVLRYDTIYPVYTNFYSSFYIFSTAILTLEGQTPPSMNNSRAQENNIVFISYAREDHEAARKLYNDLKRAGLNPWLDKESLIAGQNWKIAITDAIKKSRYFIPIFSSVSVAKRGYVQKEFRYALDVLDEFPPSQIFVIPVRLDECEIPYEKLKDIEYVDLFPNWKEGMKRIFRAIEMPDASQNYSKINNKNTQTKVTGYVHRDRAKPQIISKKVLIMILVGAAVAGTIVASRLIPSPVNEFPRANAGPNLVVSTGDKVNLDGSKSKDPDGAVTSYSWQQIGSPTVSLNGSNTANPSFIAPTVNSNTILTFNLTVKDNKGAVSTPTKVDVLVKAKQEPSGGIGISLPSANPPPKTTANNYKFVTKWIAPAANVQFSRPNGIAIDPANNVYVAVTGINRIAKFDSNGKVITSWGSEGTGFFHSPKGIAVDSDGNVYVADSGNNRIQMFDTAIVPKLITEWNSAGQLQKFNDPEGIAVDLSDNKVYVADTRNNIIQVFEFSSVCPPFSQSGTGICYASRNLGSTDLRSPRGIAVDSSHNVYVADSGHNQIVKFDSNGTLTSKWDLSGTGSSKFNNPSDVAVDQDNVYVADTGNNRIVKIDSNGTFITSWGSAGSANGEFHSPAALALDSSGNVYVADSQNDRIQVFAPLTYQRR